MQLGYGIAFSLTIDANECTDIPSYDLVTGILNIPLVNVGEAGQFQNVQVAIDKVLAGTAVDSNFVDNGDGTISQIDAGLMWQKVGSDPNLLPWEQGRDYCETLTDECLRCLGYDAFDQTLNNDPSSTVFIFQGNLGAVGLFSQ